MRQKSETMHLHHQHQKHWELHLHQLLQHHHLLLFRLHHCFFHLYFLVMGLQMECYLRLLETHLHDDARLHLIRHLNQLCGSD
jgi:hypothetical protein